MKQIINANNIILGILGKPRGAETPLCLTRYCVAVQVEEGVLLFHTLTRELLLLTQQEYDEALTSSYLRAHWFAVPESFDEKELVELVHWVRTTNRKRPKHITSYTILTTTDCNARCFYCYEHGCKKVTMTPETAQKVVSYIQNHAGEQKVNLAWFGGEPLMNVPAIDHICLGLREAGIEFKSRMTSNAYLFSDELVSRAVQTWNLKKIQITLDGTETVYNRSKAYIYPEGSAYRVVLDNISRLLSQGIAVSIRMNLDLYNGEDLLALTDELAQRFQGQKGLRAYAHLLFDTEKSGHERYTDEQWTRLYDMMHRLERKLLEDGLSASGARRLRRDIPLNHCMADAGNAVVILPEGQLGLCEHHTDDEFFGHIESQQRDEGMIASWRERWDPIPACGDCFYYPECWELKKCKERGKCSAYSRQAIRRTMEQTMLNEYRRWSKPSAEQTEETETQPAEEFGNC